MHWILNNLYNLRSQAEKHSNNIVKDTSLKKDLQSLWYIATNIRNPQMLMGYLKTAKEIENEEWSDETKRKFQILLIKNRIYLLSSSAQSFSNLNQEQQQWLRSDQMTYEQAESIFNSKEYKNAEQRGQFSLMPLIKIGLVKPISSNKSRVDNSRCHKNCICITDVGNKLLNNEISLKEALLEQFLKIQLPSVLEKRNINWHVKPFICILRLIKKVNELCEERGIKTKGLTITEFGIFALSISNYKDIDKIAQKVIDFRLNYESIKNFNSKEEYKINYINKYLIRFCNPVKNIDEYSSVIINYMRYLGFIYIRGKFGYACVDLSPNKIIEINSLLEHDNGKDIIIDGKTWLNYFTTYGTYVLPYETIEKQQEILKNILKDINRMENKLHFEQTALSIPHDKQELKVIISKYTIYRAKLKRILMMFDFEHDVSKIYSVIKNLKDIRKSEINIGLKPSIALEKWVYVALNIIGDSVSIESNSIKGDDDEPIFTAPPGKPDIECCYNDFNVISEVTMLNGRDQWYNEGQPVMRHLRDFENAHSDKISYCLFVAPSLHRDTINTFYQSNKYEYEGKCQRIVPITINQLIEILDVAVEFKKNHKVFKHDYLKELYDNIIASVFKTDSSKWVSVEIPILLQTWKMKMLNISYEKEIICV